MSKLCALVIGHKKRSPGAINANSNLSEFDFNEILALRIEKKVQNVESKGSIEEHTKSFQMI